MGEGTKSSKMRKVFVFIMMFCLVLSSSAQKKRATNNGGAGVAAAAGVVGAIAAAAYYEHQMREMVEQSAMEWFLFNKPINDGDRIEMKLIDWEIKSFTDISATRTLLFRYKVNNEPNKVVMFILSQGWWNDYGIVFTKVKPVELGQDDWMSIIKKLVLISTDSIRFTNELQCEIFYTIKTELYNVYGEFSGVKKELEKVEADFKNFKGIVRRDFVFENEDKKDTKIPIPELNGDTHLVGMLPEQKLIIDFNEKKLNLFNSDTRDLIKISNGAVKEITRTLLD